MRLPDITRIALGVFLAVSAVEMGTAQAPGVPGPPVQAGPAPRAPARDRERGAPREGTAVIRGYVVAADTGNPLRRAQVRVFAMGGNGENAMAQSDPGGRFEIARLPAGRYGLSASRSGYVTLQFGQRAPNQPGTPIELKEGQVVEKVVLALPRGGAISGRIVDEYGEPVASAQVRVQRFAYMGGVRRLTGAGAEGGGDRTDDLGQFRLYGLEPGEYYVSASLRVMEFMSMNTTSSPASTDGYAPTYYPGTPNLAEAGRISVRAGQDVTNVTFALSATRVGRISGRITSSTGEPYAVGMMMVSTRDTTRSGESFGFGGPVRPDGTFQTSPLPPGDYTLLFRPDSRSDPNAEMARVDVSVNGEDVRDLLVVASRGGIIRGRVLTDSGQVPPFRPQQMQIFWMAEDPTRMGGGGPPTIVRPDWTFEMTGLMDRVRLRGAVDGGRDGWSIRHAWKDGVDLVDTALDVTPGQVVEDVEIELTQKVTELSGMVTDDRGQAVTDATVVLFPENRERWIFGSRYLRSTRPDTNGKYSLRPTPGADYRIVVVRGLENGQASDPEFLARALEQSASLQLREGEARVLNLKLTELK